MSQTCTIHFIAPDGVTTTLTSKLGKKGLSLMDVATANNLDGIAADCGGLMTCATCHVMVQEPFLSRLAAPDAEELAMLAFTATPSQPNSRLSCQIMLSEALDGLTVTLPASQY